MQMITSVSLLDSLLFSFNNTILFEVLPCYNDFRRSE